MFSRRLVSPLVAFAFLSPALGCGGGGGGGGGADGGGGGDGSASGADAAGAAVDRASYVSTLALPPIAEDEGPTCCKDFGDISKNGTGQLDNALAELSQAISFGVDMQELIDENLRDGDLLALWNHVGLQGNSGSFALQALVGAFAGSTTYDSASAGDGTFTISPLTYNDSGEVEIEFPDAEITGGVMTAGPGTFVLAFPIGDEDLRLPLQEVEFSGEATVTDDEISYDSGQMSGYMRTADLFAALNAVASSETCSCLEIGDRDLFVQQQDGSWEGDCVEGANELCTTEEESVCATLANAGTLTACNLTPSLVEGNADLDLDDDDSAYEAISLGIEWTAAPAEIVE